MNDHLNYSALINAKEINEHLQICDWIRILQYFAINKILATYLVQKFSKNNHSEQYCLSI